MTNDDHANHPRKGAASRLADDATSVKDLVQYVVSSPLSFTFSYVHRESAMRPVRRKISHTVEPPIDDIWGQVYDQIFASVLSEGPNGQQESQ